MSETTNIGWTDHTAGPFLVCTEKSPGCAHCYARKLMENRLAPIVRRAYRAAGFADWATRPVWGRTAPRVLTKGFWSQAQALNRRAAQAARRPRMFPSLIDWLDDCPAGILDQDGQWLELADVRRRFLEVVLGCRNLDWLLLTKRPENFFACLDQVLEYGSAVEDEVKSWREGRPPDHVWIGFSAEDNARLLERWDHAKKIPAAQHFISLEPLLEDVSTTLTTVLREGANLGKKLWPIVGGESGAQRRDCGVVAILRAAEAARAAGVPVYVKQDCALRSEQQGRIPDAVWAWKQFPAL